MKRSWLTALIAANLLALLALVFIYPHLMVSPGAVVAGHADIATDCFACHAPLRGASSERCIACHALSDIGLRTSKGVALANKSVKTSFHQELIEQDCVACHSDHLGPKLTQRSRKPFSHSLLRVAVREQCQSCHKAPTDNLHRQVPGNCTQCHSQQAWKPATFAHSVLPVAVREQCQSCHKSPTDTLHRQVSGNCTQCHSLQAWKPATFAHEKFFVLDRDHNTRCETCHLNNNYKTYTCYGCHEHSPARVRAEHMEEGIRNFENCVKCHRSAQGEPENRDGGQGQSRGEGQRRGREEDD